MPFSRPENHPDDWSENLLKVNADTENSEYFADQDRMEVEIEGFTIYLTSERAIVRIEDSIVHSDLTELKFKLMDKVEQVQKWLEDNTIANFDDRFFVRFKINTQHIAIEDSPLHDFIDSYTTFDVVDYEVADEGDVLLWCDRSEGSKHTEFGGGNRPGNQVLEAQEHAEKVSTLMKSVIRRWDKWRLVIGLVEDGFLDGVYSLLRNNSRRLLRLEKRVSELEDEIDTTEGNDSLDSGNSDSNSLFIYWAKRLTIKPFITFSLEKEVIAMDDFEEVLRQKIQDEVKTQLGMYDTSQRRTENELKDLIQEELEMRPKTVTELRNALDANRSTVINQLEKLAEVDVVEEFEKDGNYYWRQK
jgi:hypothetical protein